MIDWVSLPDKAVTDKSQLLADLLGLEVWNQGMTLGLRDPKTGVKAWESQFVMPVISAFLPSGAEVALSQAATPSLALPDSPAAEDFSGVTAPCLKHAECLKCTAMSKLGSLLLSRPCLAQMMLLQK